MPALLIVGLVAVLGALVVASVAAAKGYSFWGFFLVGLLAWPLALVAVLVISDRSRGVGVGSMVKVRGAVRLDDGRQIPRGHCANVTEVSIIDGVPVVQIGAPDGSLRWIARKNVALL